MDSAFKPTVTAGIAAIVAALLCVSCVVAPFKAPPPDLPATFENAAADLLPRWPQSEWYSEFASEELLALITEATASNLDIAAASARVLQADARARAAGSALLPTLSAGPTVTHYVGRSGGQSVQETDWSVLASASYEVDFWKKNRSAAQSARLLSAAGKAEGEVMRLTTTASVATTYFQVLSLRERLAIAQSNLDTTRQVLQAIQARYDAGVASPVELATQRAAEANAQLAIPPLQQNEAEARAELALLLGRRPEEFAVSGTTLDAITEPAVTAGLPSELLQRRPDVVAAELNLEASHADLNAARAALFPSLTLTAGGGLQNPSVQAAVTTLTGTGYSLNVGAALLQTIFDAGKRRAVRAEAQAREEELVANYRTAILDALRDVEVALAAMQHLNVQREAQAQNVLQSQRAFEGASIRYREGSGDFLTMLDAQRTLYAADEQLSQYRLARLQAVVSLYKALGGGWVVAAAPADQHP
jgi:NodT family efflux transporter outer membrane factor (OMF) lipoprotein